MAFVLADLMCVFNGGAFNIWRYKSTGDTMATIDSAGYYNSASHLLLVGDVMLVQASNGHGITVISANSGGVVDANDLAVYNTNTD